MEAVAFSRPAVLKGHSQSEGSSIERGRGASAKRQSSDSGSENLQRLAPRSAQSLPPDLRHTLPLADTTRRQCAAVALPRLLGFHASGCVANDLRHQKIGQRNRRFLVRTQWAVLPLRQTALSTVPRYNRLGFFHLSSSDWAASLPNFDLGSLSDPADYLSDPLGVRPLVPYLPTKFQLQGAVDQKPIPFDPSCGFASAVSRNLGEVGYLLQYRSSASELGSLKLAICLPSILAGSSLADPKTRALVHRISVRIPRVDNVLDSVSTKDEPLLVQIMDFESSTTGSTESGVSYSESSLERSKRVQFFWVDDAGD